MRKFLIMAAAALFIGSTANAQDVFKQQGGEQNIEVLFAPLGGNPIMINGIKYRKFTSATSAIRANIFVGYQSSTEIMVAENEDETELKSGESSLDITVAGGMENHWAGTDRLSPYWGYEASVGFGTERMTDEVIINEDNDIEKLVSMSQGSITIGVGGLIGCDFYFGDNIYVGTEVGFGIQFTNDFDTKMETPGFDDDFEFEIQESTSPGGNSFGAGPFAVGQIRAGFLF